MNELNAFRITSIPAFLKRCSSLSKIAGVAVRIAVVVFLATVMVGCVKPSERSHASKRDHLLGWFNLPGRDEQNQVVPGHGTLIPVFKRDGTYYSVCNGGEVPLKECPEGLEWALTPSSMAGTKIGFDGASNAYYIVIEDAQLANNWQFYVSGQKQSMTMTERPSGLLDAKARRPRTHDDFLGWYQPVWFPGVRIEIRKDGDRYVSQEQEFSGPEPGSWKTRVEPYELVPLPDQPGFGFGRDYTTRLVHNEALKRFELVKTTTETNVSVIRMPLARVSAPSSPEGGVAPSPIARLGIPAWH